MRKLLAFLRARIGEKSTIASFSAAIPTAAQLPSPWCWFVILGAFAVALTPSSAAGGAGGR